MYLIYIIDIYVVVVLTLTRSQVRGHRTVTTLVEWRNTPGKKLKETKSGMIWYTYYVYMIPGIYMYISYLQQQFLKVYWYITFIAETSRIICICQKKIKVKSKVSVYDTFIPGPRWHKRFKARSWKRLLLHRMPPRNPNNVPGTHTYMYGMFKSVKRYQVYARYAF